jgi:hypothetical protein
VLLRFKLVEFVPLGHLFRAVEALAAFSAAVWAVRKEQQDPEFQDASALGPMNVVASAKRAVSFLGIDEHAEFASHSQDMLAPGSPARNRPFIDCAEAVIEN